MSCLDEMFTCDSHTSVGGIFYVGYTSQGARRLHFVGCARRVSLCDVGETKCAQAYTDSTQTKKSDHFSSCTSSPRRLYFVGCTHVGYVTQAALRRMSFSDVGYTSQRNFLKSHERVMTQTNLQHDVENACTARRLSISDVGCCTQDTLRRMYVGCTTQRKIVTDVENRKSPRRLQNVGYTSQDARRLTYVEKHQNGRREQKLSRRLQYVGYTSQKLRHTTQSVLRRLHFVECTYKALRRETCYFTQRVQYRRRGHHILYVIRQNERLF